MEYWENIWQSLTNADLDNHIHSANMLSHVNNKTILWWTNSMWSGENIWTFPLNNSGLNFTNVWLFQRDGGVNQGVLNSYCWMYSTFNIPPSFQGNQEPDSMFIIVIVLCFIGNCFKREHDGNTLYNTYYQWVAIFLVIQVEFWPLVVLLVSFIFARPCYSTFPGLCGWVWREVWWSSWWGMPGVRSLRRRWRREMLLLSLSG